MNQSTQDTIAELIAIVFWLALCVLCVIDIFGGRHFENHREKSEASEPQADKEDLNG